MNKWLSIIIINLAIMVPSFGLNYDYTSTKSIPVQFQIIEEINTKNPPAEGSKVKFKAVSDAVYDGKTIVKKGDIVSATVETIITSGMNGFPAEIIVDRFEIPHIEQSQLEGTFIKKGQNRCLWVYPLKWSLTPIPFVGSLTNLIMGGHARIKPSDVITVYYYPEWK